MTDFVTEVFGFRIPVTPAVVLPLLVLATILLAYVVYFLLTRLISAIMRRATIGPDARIDWLVERYLFPLLIIVGLWSIVDIAPLPAKIERAAERMLSLTGLIVVIVVVTKSVLLVLRDIAARYQPLGNIRAPVELVTKIVLFAIGGMLILDNLGVSLTPLLTTLGIGSLAVAIALQDTLGNAFAGLHIKADRPIEVGQFVRLDNGDEGYVERIGWRSTGSVCYRTRPRWFPTANWFKAQSSITTSRIRKSLYWWR